MKLYTKILLALVVGATIGIVAKLYDIVWLRDTVIALEPIGTAFVRTRTLTFCSFCAAGIGRFLMLSPPSGL